LATDIGFGSERICFEAWVEGSHELIVRQLRVMFCKAWMGRGASSREFFLMKKNERGWRPSTSLRAGFEAVPFQILRH